MTSRKRIRILYCETNVDGTIGGSYYSLLYLIKALDKSRFAPIVVFYANHGLLDAFESTGAETMVWPKSGTFRFVDKLPRAFEWARPLAQIAQKGLNLIRGFLWPTAERIFFLVRRRIDLVHLNNSILYNHDWMLAARLTGRPCVSHERGINEHYPSAAKYWGRHLDAIICISDAVRAMLRSNAIDGGNLITIHNGFDPAEVQVEESSPTVRERLEIPLPADLVVMVGNFKAWKGQETVIRAIDVVRRTRGGVRCLLVGATAAADQAFEHEMRTLVSSLDLTNHVLFAGFHRNVCEVLLVADVVVHASVRPEPFGRVILEAMACRKPVIGARAGGVPEIIDDGRTGLMFPPGDHQALAACILELLTDRNRARCMGEEGYQRLVDRFHLARNVEATERVYAQILPRTA